MSTDPVYLPGEHDAESARRRSERRQLDRAIAAGRALPHAADLFPELAGTPKPVGPQSTLTLED